MKNETYCRCLMKSVYFHCYLFCKLTINIVVGSQRIWILVPSFEFTVHHVYINNNLNNLKLFMCYFHVSIYRYEDSGQSTLRPTQRGLGVRQGADLHRLSQTIDWSNGELQVTLTLPHKSAASCHGDDQDPRCTPMLWAVLFTDHTAHTVCQHQQASSKQ